MNRKTAEDRARVLGIIEERIKICGKTDMIPLNIFPEGTTSNGEQLLTFKKGSFTTLTPVKILCVKYESDMLIPFDCEMGMLNSQLACMCSWSCKITLYEFEGNYDPKYLNLDPNDDNAWKIYAEKVRDVMAKCLNVPKLPLGYRHARAFGKIYRKYTKLLRNIHSGKVLKFARS